MSDSDSSSSSSESDDSDIEKNEDKFSSVLFMQVQCVRVTLVMNWKPTALIIIKIEQKFKVANNVDTV